MNYLVRIVVVVFGLAASVSGCGNQTAQTPTPEALEEASRMPAHELGHNVLATAQALESLNIVRLGMSRSYPPNMVIYNPDGTRETVTLRTSEEIEQFATKYRRLHETYKEAVIRRGFKQLAPSYDATVSPGCPDRWFPTFTSGEVVVRQNDFMFILVAGGPFDGAVVEDTITVITPLSVGVTPIPTPLSLRGRYGNTIELRDAQSKCKITLRARP